MRKIIFVLALSLSLPVMAGGNHHKPSPPVIIVTPPVVVPPPVVIVNPPATPAVPDQVHHESRSSKAAKVLGVIGLGLISYHIIWHPKGRNDVFDGRSQVETTVEARGQ